VLGILSWCNEIPLMRRFGNQWAPRRMGYRSVFVSVRSCSLRKSPQVIPGKKEATKRLPLVWAGIRAYGNICIIFSKKQQRSGSWPVFGGVITTEGQTAEMRVFASHRFRSSKITRCNVCRSIRSCKCSRKAVCRCFRTVLAMACASAMPVRTDTRCDISSAAM